MCVCDFDVIALTSSSLLVLTSTSLMGVTAMCLFLLLPWSDTFLMLAIHAPFLSISLLLLLLRSRVICFVFTFSFPTCGMSPEHKRFFFFNIINFYISNFGFLYVQHIPYIKLVNYDEQKKKKKKNFLTFHRRFVFQVCKYFGREYIRYPSLYA